MAAARKLRRKQISALSGTLNYHWSIDVTASYKGRCRVDWMGVW